MRSEVKSKRAKIAKSKYEQFAALSMLRFDSDSDCIVANWIVFLFVHSIDRAFDFSLSLLNVNVNAIFVQFTCKIILLSSSLYNNSKFI